VQGQPADSHAAAGAARKTETARDRPGRLCAALLRAPQAPAEVVRQSPPCFAYVDFLACRLYNS